MITPEEQKRVDALERVFDEQVLSDAVESMGEFRKKYSGPPPPYNFQPIVSGTWAQEAAKREAARRASR